MYSCTFFVCNVGRPSRTKSWRASASRTSSSLVRARLAKMESRILMSVLSKRKGEPVTSDAADISRMSGSMR